MSMIPIGEAMTAQRPSNSTSSFSRRGQYKPTGTELSRVFHKELNSWREATMFLSSSTDMADHPSFKAIVALGEKVIPLIMAELKVRPSRLVMALSAITGENPVVEKDNGNTRAIVSAWQTWFVNHKR